MVLAILDEDTITMTEVFRRFRLGINEHRIGTLENRNSKTGKGNWLKVYPSGTILRIRFVADFSLRLAASKLVSKMGRTKTKT